jgi:hypothetical protein
MTGMDFFSALENYGVELPVRIFTDGKHPNFYRPNRLGFCDLTLEDGDEITPKQFERLGCFDVTIMADAMDERIRELTKALIAVRPKHLAVMAGNTFCSWAPDRGWA